MPDCPSHMACHELTLWIRSYEARRAWNDAFFDGKNGLQEARYSGRRLRMSDVAFDLLADPESVQSLQ